MKNRCSRVEKDGFFILGLKCHRQIVRVQRTNRLKQGFLNRDRPETIHKFTRPLISAGQRNVRFCPTGWRSGHALNSYEVLGSNLGRDVGCPDWGLSWSLQANAEKVPRFGHYRLLPNPVEIHLSLYPSTPCFLATDIGIDSPKILQSSFRPYGDSRNLNGFRDFHAISLIITCSFAVTIQFAKCFVCYRNIFRKHLYETLLSYRISKTVPEWKYTLNGCCISTTFPKVDRIPLRVSRTTVWITAD
jgi:hypothetical protein